MRSTTLRLSIEEYWIVQQHKSLLRCDTWEAYLERLLLFPRQRHEPIYDTHENLQIKTITMRMTDDLFERVNKQRKRFFKPWREFILEAAYEDGTVDSYHHFCARSKIVMNTRSEPIE